MQQLTIVQFAEVFGLTRPEAYGAIKFLMLVGAAQEVGKHKRGGLANLYMVDVERIQQWKNSTSSR